MKPQTFAARLQSAIEASGLSVQALAEKAGVSRQGIHKLISSGEDPKWSTVQKLADALGITVEALRTSA